MAGVGYAGIEARQRQLMRKAKQGSVFIAPTSAEHITEDLFADPTDHLILRPPAGYNDLGLATTDGVAFASTLTKSDVTSWGFSTPTRTDLLTEDTTATMSFQETNKQTLALYCGVEPEAVVSTNGVTAIYKPTAPIRGEYHVLFLAVDEAPEGEVYIARYWPVATLTDKANQGYAQGDNPILWPAQLSARPDEDLGTPEVFLFGGPGWFAQLEDMGIEDTSVATP